MFQGFNAPEAHSEEPQSGGFSHCNKNGAAGPGMMTGNPENILHSRPTGQVTQGLWDHPNDFNCSVVAPHLRLSNNPDGQDAFATAVELGGPVLLAYCKDSSFEALIAHLYHAFSPQEPEVIGLHLGSCWPLQLHGEQEKFETCVARTVSKTLETVDAKCVLLAQNSMIGAAGLIETSVPVFTLATDA
jgi:hypothetical protein